MEWVGGWVEEDRTARATRSRLRTKRKGVMITAVKRMARTGTPSLYI